jgi:hypothetical protein
MWIVFSPLLEILLSKFWQWIINNQKIRLQIVTLYLTWLIHHTTIKELSTETDSITSRSKFF